MANKNIFIKPLITEKATAMSEKQSKSGQTKYGFVVDRKTDKDQIKAAVESMYGVKVEAVNTMNYGGGKARLRHTSKGVAYERKKTWKKAVVTVATGDYIDFYASI